MSPYPVRYQPLLFDATLAAPGFVLGEVVAEMRAAHFPEIVGEIEVRVADAGPMAFVDVGFMGRDRHLIVFHPVLNHPGTPAEIVRFMAKHELTHLVVPDRMIAGAWEAHPPEFWCHEYRVGPERDAVWHWVHANIGRCLMDTAAGLRVTRRWAALRARRRGPYTPWLPFNGERWERVCPGSGGQIALPASWAGRRLR